MIKYILIILLFTKLILNCLDNREKLDDLQYSMNLNQKIEYILLLTETFMMQGSMLNFDPFSLVPIFFALPRALFFSCLFFRVFSFTVRC